jgi:hypothetical protein
MWAAGTKYPSMVAETITICNDDPEDGLIGWELKFKLYAEMPTCVKHTLYIRPALCRLSAWMDLIQKRTALSWSTGPNEGGHISCHDGGYEFHQEDAHGSSYTVRVPHCVIDIPLSQRILEASRRGLPFAPEALEVAPPAFGPGSASPAFGPGSASPAFGPGSASPAFGPGSAPPAFGPGSAPPAFGPGTFGASALPAFCSGFSLPEADGPRLSRRPTRAPHDEDGCRAQ